jgi:hypothetical protein
MINRLPSTLLEFSPDMLSLKLISYLASSVFFLPYPRRQDEPESLKNIYDKVVSAEIVLRQLFSIFRGEVSLTDEGNATTSRRNTVGEAASSEVEANRKTLIELGFPVPKDSSEAFDIAKTMLRQQKQNMKVACSSIVCQQWLM